MKKIHDLDLIVESSKEQENLAQKFFNKSIRELTKNELLIIDKYIYDHRFPEWKQVIINGKKTHYAISNTGLLQNMISGKMSKGSLDGKGYLLYCIDYKSFKAHRLVAEAFIPNPENKPQVNHINGDKTCNWVGNLEWVTCQENITHAIKTGLFYVGLGEKANASVYTNAQIHEVCRLLEKGLKNTEVSAITGVDVYVISKIKCKNCWQHISDQYNIAIPNGIAKGSDSAHAKYTDEKIHKVCQMLKDGCRVVDIFRATNVSRDMIQRIKAGKNWNHIASQYGIEPFKKN